MLPSAPIGRVKSEGPWHVVDPWAVLATRFRVLFKPSQEDPVSPGKGVGLSSPGRAVGPWGSAISLLVFPCLVTGWL